MKTRRQAVAFLIAIVSAIALSIVPVAPLWADLPQASEPPPRSIADVKSAYGHLPLNFEANQGQTDSQVKFLSRGQGYNLFLTSTEAVLALASHDPAMVKGKEFVEGIKQAVLRMNLVGANPMSSISGLDALPSKANYFIGNDPQHWRTNVPTYVKVQYKDVYPGVDLVFYGNQGQLEYDFIVAPGADPNAIALTFNGADHLSIDGKGDLVLQFGDSHLRLQKPFVYQMINGFKQQIPGSYRLDGQQQITFQLALYDPSKPLVIDPTLSYSTYLGGHNRDQGQSIAVDSTGNAYVTGHASSSNFPIASPLQPVLRGIGPEGFGDVFVAKLNAAGTALVYSTYLGGVGDDNAQGIVLDTTNNAYITGRTNSFNFPTTGAAFDSTYNGGPSCGDAFVTKLSSSGSTLVYSTYVGGTGEDCGSGIAVDTAGNAYIIGTVRSMDFPTTPGAFQPAFGGGFSDAFVTKLNSTGTGPLLYSTYLGGNNSDQGQSIAVDSSGHAYVAGDTHSTNFPITVGAFQTTVGGGSDGFVAKLNSTGSVPLIYSTYLGGNNSDQSSGIAVDAAGNAYVTGNTNSTNFPITVGAFQTVFGGITDVFVTKLNSSGSAPLIYSTYLGGNNNDNDPRIALDSLNNAYVTGVTNSTNFPITSGAVQTAFAGGIGDAFVTKLKPTGSGPLLYSTYLGGNGSDSGLAIAIDTLGNAYISGFTGSTNFPVTPGAFQTSFGGVNDAFVTKISFEPTANAGPDQSVPEGALVTLDGSTSIGGSLTYQWTHIAGPSISLTGADTVHPTFTAPLVPAAGATATFELVVCEGTSSNCSDPDSVNVHITDVNHPPIADAGPDQTVQEGSPVVLDGTGSYDPDLESVIYQWTQNSGPAVSLTLSNTASPSFTAPPVGPAGATLVFDLTVADPHTLTGSDTVSIHISNLNQSPIADAGPDQTVNENTLVILNGTGSSDPDLDALSYSWIQIAGPTVVLTGGTTANPTFTAPSVVAGGTTLTFRLIVSDGQASSAEDTVTIHVQDANDPPVCTLAQPSVASLWPPNHTMVPVTIMGVTDPNDQAITISFPAVTQDEPVNGLGDGDTSPDAAASGNQILLRAERAGTGNGRVYVVHFTAMDDQGGSCNGSVKVSVPHSKKDLAGEGAQLYNSFAP